MTGLVAVDPEAIGRDQAGKGRLVLNGIYFGFDSATLQAPSAEALAAAATYLAAHPGESFRIVGHTDSRGSLDCNSRLSLVRAEAVAEALVDRHAVPGAQISTHGVGPLAPVFSNATDAERERDRRVDLIEGS